LIEPAPGGVAVLGSGVISTSADLPLEARIHLIYDGVRSLLEAQTPTVLVLEDLYAEYKFPRTALLMAHARGVICLAARQSDVAVLALRLSARSPPLAPPRSIRCSTPSSGSSSSPRSRRRRTSPTRSRSR
jgi:hypothetical protein